MSRQWCIGSTSKPKHRQTKRTCPEGGKKRKSFAQTILTGYRPNFSRNTTITSPTSWLTRLMLKGGDQKQLAKTPTKIVISVNSNRNKKVSLEHGANPNRLSRVVLQSVESAEVEPGSWYTLKNDSQKTVGIFLTVFK